ncbi:hypothetical protein C8J57DRAFT_1716630 [Mycena rebaudengoi]|nr:hypothetical protein C8J57DRAFT_1716630 [Mycena rebaudengoi]
MSVAEIRAQLADLSSSIDKKRKVLPVKELERSRVALRRLNAPLALLPLEILSQIFIFCLPEDFHPCPSDAMLLRNICSSWTNIALATPAPWSTIRIDRPTAAGLDAEKRWIARAGTRPLSVIFGHLKSNLLILFQYAPQIHHLELCLGSGDHFPVAPFSSQKTLTVNFVEYTLVGLFPCVENGVEPPLITRTNEMAHTHKFDARHIRLRRRT